MSNPAINSLLSRVNQPDLLEKLATLSSSELNSLLMEVFRQDAAQVTPQDLMRAYQENRFVAPSSLDPIVFAKGEVELLDIASKRNFKALELSPLAPLGNCSAIGLADQNKIVSALRGTEIVADATNLMALESSVRRKSLSFSDEDVNLCAIHRHVRAQALTTKGHTAHFKIFCALTAGRDKGSHIFEKAAVLSHLEFYNTYLVDTLKMNGISVVIKAITGTQGDLQTSKAIFEHVKGRLGSMDLTFLEVPADEHRYYRHTRFSINLDHNGMFVNLGDGGFVDWGMKLTSNAKELMFTSGIGFELLIKLRLGMI